MISNRHAAVVAGLCALLLAVPHAAKAEPPKDLPGGGLWIVNDPALITLQHDVQISTGEIGATYVVRNTGNVARTVLVAFALPDIDMAAIGDQPVTIPAPQSTNFVAATFSVDGTPVPVEIERRGIAYGLDITRTLEELKIPLFPFAKGIDERLGKLPDQVKSELEERGIARFFDSVGMPLWTLKSTAHWRQTIGSGQPLTINVAYRPVAAEAAFAPELITQLRESHCIDRNIEAEITRLVAAKSGKVTFRWMTYALTAGSQLVNDVSAFRLLVNKPSIETVIATCRKDARRPGPTTLEWSAKNFHPDDDLHILFVN